MKWFELACSSRVDPLDVSAAPPPAPCAEDEDDDVFLTLWEEEQGELKITHHNVLIQLLSSPVSRINIFFFFSVKPILPPHLQNLHGSKLTVDQSPCKKIMFIGKIMTETEEKHKQTPGSLTKQQMKKGIKEHVRR